MDSDCNHEAETCVVCGDEVVRPLRMTRTVEEDECYPNGCGCTNAIYDITMKEAKTYLGKHRGKPKDEFSFEFVNELWLKRAIHAGLLHGAIYGTGDYYFDLYELDKLRENIIAYGGADPLNKGDARKIVCDSVNNIGTFEPAFNDEYGRHFYEVILRNADVTIVKKPIIPCL